MDRDTRALAEFVVLWTVLLVMGVLVHHVTLRGGWLGLPYYTVHFFVPVLLTMIALLATVARPEPATSPRVLPAPLIVATLLLLSVVWAFSSRPSGGVLWVAGTAAALLLVVAFAGDGVLRRRVGGIRAESLVPLLVTGVLLALWASPSQVPTAGAFASMAQRNAFEWDVFEHQLSVQRIVEASTSSEERLMFWHTTVMPQGEWMTRINMVYYGTGQGRLHDKRDPVGMPNLPFDISGDLLDVRPLNLVLISPDTFEVEAGLLALRSRGLDPRVVHQETLDGEVLDLQVLLVRLD
jgi:hypothetical protein